MNTYRTHRHRCGMNNLFKRIGMMSLAVSLLAACATDDDVPDSSVTKTDRDEYTLTLTLSAGSLNTRSEGHGTDPGTDDDAFINIAQNDYAIFIFDDAGQFVQRFEPGAVSLQRDPNNNKYKYVLNGALKPERELEKMQMMVLANECKDFGANYFEVEKLIASQTLSQIYANSTQFNFTMPVAASSTSWIPTTNQTGIPMFGLSDVVALDDDLVELTKEIPMLRSLAKIEIVDMVPNGQSANIEKCVLTKYNTSGRFIPDVTNNPLWNGADKENTQITTPSLPDLHDGVDIGSNLYFAKTTRMVRTKGADEDESKDCFVVYLPEMDLKDVADDARPTLSVDINGRSYPIYLCDYNKDGKPDDQTKYTSLLRNHLYRYNILAVGAEAELTITTENWDLDADQVWDYEDLKVDFADGGEFKWENPNYDPSDINDRTLLVTTEDGAVGRFTLKSIKDSKWVLSLVTDDGTPIHWFRIDLWEGTEEDGHWVVEDQAPGVDKFIADTQSGDIDENKPVKFRIIATDTNGSALDYTARVVLTLQTFDGRVLNVNLINSETEPSSDADYYKVKQLTNGGDNM